MKKTDLINITGISTPTLAKLSIELFLQLHLKGHLEVNPNALLLKFVYSLYSFTSKL